MLDDVRCSFLIVIKNYLVIKKKKYYFVRKVLWVPYGVFEEGGGMTLAEGCTYRLKKPPAFYS